MTSVQSTEQEKNLISSLSDIVLSIPLKKRRELRTQINGLCDALNVPNDFLSDKRGSHWKEYRAKNQGARNYEVTYRTGDYAVNMTLEEAAKAVDRAPNYIAILVSRDGFASFVDPTDEHEILVIKKLSNVKY